MTEASAPVGPRMAAELLPDPASCVHCGLPIPPGPKVYAEIRGVLSPMCCVGCSAAAEMIEAAGLGDWYARREGPSGQAAALPADVLDRLAHLESDAFEDEFVDRKDEGGAETSLLVDELRCAACVWVIERHLGALEGVRSVRVSLASKRVQVVWDSDALRLRDLITRLAEIGFAARPDRPGAQADQDQRERRGALIRLGVAGLGAMNVMTYSVALYFGALDGMTSASEALMRWMGWLVSTPIVLVSARPFFVGAWRDLSRRRPGMDVPVALAIGGAYVVSVIATVNGTGEVYFDSVCMFTFFLSLGRFLEQRVRLQSAAFVRERVDAAPALARRLPAEGLAPEDAREEVVPARALKVGDRLRVLAGEAIPADGRIVSGSSGVDESLLTGEAWMRPVSIGDSVVAGSHNGDQPLVIEAERVGQETTLAAILALVERASAERAPVALLADRVAGYFVSAVLIVGAINWVVWNTVDPSRAIWTTLAVLVATCPCALSLATPMAMGAASQGLARRGFLIANARVLASLVDVDRFVFDKTGTLTEGRPIVSKTVLVSDLAESEALRIAGALERDSTHPVARAFLANREAGENVSHRENIPGAGVSGEIRGRRYRLGRPDWALPGEAGAAERAALISGDPSHPSGPSAAGRGEVSEEVDPRLWVVLADEKQALAWFGLEDPVRPEAEVGLSGLRARGLLLELLSGDPSGAAAELADRLRLEHVRPAATPEDKLDRIRDLQKQGERVAIVGDGVNDSPSIQAADISIGMGSGCDLTRLGADAVLLKDDLSLLPEAIEWALRTRRVIVQNLAGSLAYNLIALPLAVTGYLAPWMAALGMSASSLAVVLNALRLKNARSTHLPETKRAG
ncbi:MAG: heavy metal translocating P-type ATPase [Myxococcota bacterium]